jgi:glycosyltransferase involved in cell wall biosynthesis
MTMTTPRVSVGLPVFNGELHLGQAVDSILGQSFTDLELIISDNGSTDRTPEICRSYAASDKRVRYFRNPENIGVARNYNIVFGHARGEYFKWASANDYCESSFIAECVAVLDRRQDVVLVCPHTHYVPPGVMMDDTHGLELLDDSPYVRFTTFLKLIRLNNVFNGLIRARALKRTGLNKNFRGSDVNVIAELALHGKFAVVPKLLFNRRMDSLSATRLRSDALTEQMFEPKRNGPLMFQSWKEYLEYFAGVRRARPPWSERASLYRYLMGRVVKDRGDLLADLLQAGRRILGGPSTNSR